MVSTTDLRAFLCLLSLGSPPYLTAISHPIRINHMTGWYILGESPWQRMRSTQGSSHRIGPLLLTGNSAPGHSEHLWWAIPFSWRLFPAHSVRDRRRLWLCLYLRIFRAGKCGDWAEIDTNNVRMVKLHRDRRKKLCRWRRSIISKFTVSYDARLHQEQCPSMWTPYWH